MDNISIASLREFAVLAQTLNFTKASTYLNITQAALSKHLKALEAALGVELIERDTSFVQLTDAGRVFLEESHNVISAFEKTVRDTQEAARYKPTVISVNGSYSHGAVRLFTALMGNHRTGKTRLDVNLDTESYPTLQLTLDNDDSDLFVLQMSDKLMLDGFTIRPFFTDRICAIISADNPLANEESITLEMLAQSPVMLSTGSSRYENKDVIEELFKKAGLTPMTKLQLVRNSDSYFNSVTFDVINLIPNSSRPYYPMLDDPHLCCKVVDGDDAVLHYALAYRNDVSQEVIDAANELLALDLPEGLASWQVDN